VAAVARAEGVRPEAFDGFDPAVFASGAPAAAADRCFAAMAAHNRRSEKTHSGIWRDLAVRRRPTEVDAQLGVVVEIAEGHGLAVPLTRRLVALIHEAERGRPQGEALLAALAAPGEPAR
jgi:2-dehydropantoate 2-reductase